MMNIMNELAKSASIFSAFVNSFKSMNQIETLITKLTNRSLLHSLDTTTSNRIMKDLFTYIVIERYNDQQFYDIMIDSDIFRHSTAKYKQYLAYSKDNENLIKLNIITAERVIVQFEVESVFFIESIMIQLSIDSIEFHIVKANIFFLFCLADMNRLRVFFGNVINMLVTKN